MIPVNGLAWLAGQILLFVHMKISACILVGKTEVLVTGPALCSHEKFQPGYRDLGRKNEALVTGSARLLI